MISFSQAEEEFEADPSIDWTIAGLGIAALAGVVAVSMGARRSLGLLSRFAQSRDCGGGMTIDDFRAAAAYIEGEFRGGVEAALSTKEVGEALLLGRPVRGLLSEDEEALAQHLCSETRANRLHGELRRVMRAEAASLTSSQVPARGRRLLG